jgi:hypothetical protein
VVYQAQNDFDGDGKSDVAVYQGATGSWYIRAVDGRVLGYGLAWGGSGYGAVSGDYDGDGRSDLGVYGGGTWFARTLAGAVVVWGTSWGASGFEPVGAPWGDGQRPGDLWWGWWFIRAWAGSWWRGR